jgi:hypothetical protein
MEILIEAYAPFRPEYLRAAYSDPHSSIAILTTFHRFEMTVSCLPRSVLMTRILVFGKAV